MDAHFAGKSGEAVTGVYMQCRREIVSSIIVGIGVAVVGLTTVRWTSIVLVPLFGLASGCLILPLVPFWAALRYADNVTYPDSVFALSLVMACVSGIAWRGCNVDQRIFVAKRTATALGFAGWFFFFPFLIVELKYGVYLGRQTAERQSHILPFVPLGIAGAILMIEAAIISLVVALVTRVSWKGFKRLRDVNNPTV